MIDVINGYTTVFAACGVILYSYWGTCPLIFQLLIFSGHFRGAQTLTLDSINYGCLLAYIALLLFVFIA